jgi:dihydroflavonol-4-reductase
MKVLLTGADGFLGSNLTRELIGRGHKVRAMVQVGRDHVTIEDLPVEIVTGDLLDEQTVFPAVDGCDAVIHTAASTSIWPRRSPIVRRINIDGTRIVLEAAKRARVKRFVHVGTANTFEHGTREVPGDETGGYVADAFGMDYMDSKYAAHRLVKAAAERGDVPVIEVNPTFMFGPYDRAPGPGKIILRVCRGEVPGSAPGGKNCIAVKDAAVAMANALEMGRVGESYILGNQNMTYHELFNAIASEVGEAMPQRIYADWMVHLTGLAMTVSGMLRRIEPRLSRAMAKVSCSSFFYTAAKAVRELQLPQSPVEEGIRAAYEWFLHHGYIYDENGRLHRNLPMPRLS